MARKVLYILLPLFISVSISAMADPIQDSIFQPKKVGWFWSSGKQCKYVCRNNAAIAEYEPIKIPSLDPRLVTGSVCKAPTKYIDPRQKMSGWLYGTNLNAHKWGSVCALPNFLDFKKTLFAKKFMCLCVKYR